MPIPIIATIAAGVARGAGAAATGGLRGGAMGSRGALGGGTGGAAGRMSEKVNKMHLDSLSEEKKNRNKTAKEAKNRMASLTGINMNTSSMLRQSQVFTGIVGGFFQLIGGLVDVMMMPIVPLVLPIFTLLAGMLPIIMAVSMFFYKITKPLGDILDLGMKALIPTNWGDMLEAVFDADAYKRKRDPEEIKRVEQEAHRQDTLIESVIDGNAATSTQLAALTVRTAAGNAAALQRAKDLNLGTGPTSGVTTLPDLPEAGAPPAWSQDKTFMKTLKKAYPGMTTDQIIAMHRSGAIGNMEEMQAKFGTGTRADQSEINKFLAMGGQTKGMSAFEIGLRGTQTAAGQAYSVDLMQQAMQDAGFQQHQSLVNMGYGEGAHTYLKVKDQIRDQTTRIQQGELTMTDTLDTNM